MDIKTEQKLRGFITSIISGFISNGMNYILVKYTPISSLLSSIISIYVFGSVFAYCLDILFAKKSFYFSSNNKEHILDYSNFKERIIWMLRSFFRPPFLKFIITIILDTLIGVSVYKYLVKVFDDNHINFKYRNILISMLIASVTFVLYVNILRFDWAYQEKTDILMNTVVLAWTTIIIVLYSWNSHLYDEIKNRS